MTDKMKHLLPLRLEIHAGLPGKARILDKDGVIVINWMVRVVAEFFITAANDHYSNQEKVDELLASLQVILDAVDYTSGNLGGTEMVSAVLPKVLIVKARAAIAQAKGGSASK